MFRKLLAPVTLQWELTHLCNQKCIHCYNFWRENDNRVPALAYDFYDKVVDEIIKNKVFSITLTGGEPLLVLDKAFKSLFRLKESGIGINLNSNLSILNPALIETLKKLRVRSVLTSLTSDKEEEHDYLVQSNGSFYKTINGIKLAVKSGLRVSVNMVVSKKNLDSIFETAKLAKGLGACLFAATKASVPTNCLDFSEFHLDGKELERMFSELIRVKEELGIEVDSLEHYPSCCFANEKTRKMFGLRSCSAGKTCCTIGFDGNIRPCSHANKTYGNISRGLAQAWEEMSEWRGIDLIPVFCKDKCFAFNKSCSGGCRMEAFGESKKLEANDPFCTKIPPSMSEKVTPINLADNALARVNGRVKFREEDFGALAFVNSSKWIAIDPALYGVLSKQENIDINILSNVLSVSRQEAKKTMLFLLDKKIIKVCQ